MPPMLPLVTGLVLALAVAGPTRADTPDCTTDDFLLASDGQLVDLYGFGMDVRDGRVIVGAPSDIQIFRPGGAYIYEMVGDDWGNEVKLVAPDGVANDLFGNSVAISGNVAVAGAPRHDTLGADSGAAYVYRFDGATWNFEQKLTGTDTNTGDWFGWDVDVEGDTIMVAAHRNDAPFAEVGTVYVFNYNGAAWTQQQTLHATGDPADDWFGYAVDFRGDVAVVTALLDDDAGPNGGAAYLFRRNGAGVWTHEQKVWPPDADFFEQSGRSAAIRGDVAIIGSPSAWHDGVLGSGRAFIYRFNGATWDLDLETGTSQPSEGAATGTSVAIQGDTAVVGCRNDNGAGHAFVFEYDGAQWNEVVKLIPSGGLGAGSFAGSLALDDGIIAVGSYGDNENGVFSGSASVFTLGDCGVGGCDGDLDGSGGVDGADLAALLAAWGTPGADLNGDGDTDGADLAILLAGWGGC